MWQCESCNILVPARRDRCPKGHDRPPTMPASPPVAEQRPTWSRPAAEVHRLGPLPPPVESGQGPAQPPSFEPLVFEMPPVFQPPHEPRVQPVPVPPAREEVGEPYFALRLSVAGETLSSVRYPVLDNDGEPVLWAYEEKSPSTITVDSLASNVDDRIRRHDSGGRIILTNRRLIVISTTAPMKNKGWQNSWGSEPKPQPSDRLMGHALWEWVSQVQCRAAVAGPSVDVVMSTREGDSPRFVLSFAARGASAKQRAQHLASAIAEAAAEFKDTEPQRQDQTWFFDGYLPVGEVQ